MNKYFKALALTGGVISAIIPTTLKIENKSTCNDLAKIYEDVTNMDEIKPRQSRINYKLNIDTNSSSSNENVSFGTENENGEQKPLTDNETLSYLDATLEEVSSEYNLLKDTLTKAIKDTMDYLDNAKENNTLTNEQKIYLKEHTNSIKFLAETLEDLSEDVLCCIDGVDCEKDDMKEITAKYLKTIDNLEDRINALQNSLNSLQLMNGISNPYFYATYNYPPNHIVYGLRYGKRDNSHNSQIGENNQNDENSNNESDAENNQTSNDNADNEQSDTENSADNQQQTQNNEDTNSNQHTDTNAQVGKDSEDYKTFNLKSNIDTYAPTRRNIDTFFNTALLDNEYGYGYGNGGMYGYGMPYGMGYGNMGGYYGNPYGNMGYEGYNSNMINRKTLEENAQNNYMPNSPTANVEQPEEIDSNNQNKPSKKPRVKRTSNIDTYNQATVKSNINSMGESRISKFFKEKFSSIKNKVRNKKQQTEQNFDNAQDLTKSDNQSKLDNAQDNCEQNDLKNINENCITQTEQDTENSNNRENNKDRGFTTLEAIDDRAVAVNPKTDEDTNANNPQTLEENRGNFIKKEDIRAR